MDRKQKERLQKKKEKAKRSKSAAVPAMIGGDLLPTSGWQSLLVQQYQQKAKNAKATRDTKVLPPPTDRIYQFKISLRHSDPLIWRRIQIPDVTLGQMHWFMQDLFEWDNDHLHDFEIEKQRYGVPQDDDFGFGMNELDEDRYRLSELIPEAARKRRWWYNYDFGDSWDHELEFERYVKPGDPSVEYPVCIAGELRGPPEDSGGMWGYYQKLEALADPKNPDHEYALEWLDGWDAEKFDVEAATNNLRKNFVLK